MHTKNLTTPHLFLRLASKKHPDIRILSKLSIQWEPPPMRVQATASRTFQRAVTAKLAETH
jgi:hypothetical protein